ncbi:MAG: aminopeptidase P family protein [Acidimicrobiales bacterium]
MSLDGPLPAMDVASRGERLRFSMAEASPPLEALLVTSLTNVGYLSGFWGTAGMLVVLPEGTVILTDGRYGTQARDQLEAVGVESRVEVVPAGRQGDVLAGTAKAAGVTRLGVEARHVSWAQQHRLAEEWLPGIELVATEGLVEGLRRVKDPGELARMARAAAIADRALGEVCHLLDEGTTEAALALAIDSRMRQLGASGPSFETIVASGPNAAKPHHRPTGRAIEEGEAVVVDFGARFDGYCSDTTRTLSLGELRDSGLRRVFEVVVASQAAGVSAVRAGVAAKEVDSACREVIEAAGWAERFVHGTGHGVGLEIHEAPAVAATSTDTLACGHVVTVEPGVYLPGVGGVRIEDTVVVTEAGCAALTLYPKS